MIDPAALGTLRIGLDARHDDERAAFERARSQPSRARLGSARFRLAATLRTIAARVEPAVA